ncbi:unnamed protein product [Allacma fusca]|uniref:Peptidase S1 domain-containing protein n=1 Tax=Allacma fusca TaxID=39272 RepID=A0A8J2NS83_9HEXA|nr:unnamed protein product [Allacma fusca]
MKIFVVAYLLAWTITAFSDATPKGTSHPQMGPKGRMTPMKSKEASPLIVGGLEQVSGIDAAILHPNYDRRTLDYDYGVLRLSHNLTFNNYVSGIPLAGIGTVTERMMCAGGEALGGCLGDSGGPLVCNGSLAGILSWGEFGCAEGKLPTVFASVAAERTWIESH